MANYEEWNKSPQEILAELNSQPVHEHIQKISQQVKINPAEAGSLFALAWYSLNRYPRNYLEFGIRYGYAAAVVASACPGVEIYGLDSWQPVNNQPVPPPYYATGILQRVGYQGYTRLVTGEPSGAFRRLKNSFIGTFLFDLVLFRADIFGAAFLEQLNEIVPHLSPGGALVFASSSDAVLTSAWNELRGKFPHFIYLTLNVNNINTGLLLALPPSFRRKGMQFFIHHCLAYDGGAEDYRLLNTLGIFLMTKPQLCLYGAGKLCRYMLSQFPRLKHTVRFILEDESSLQGKAVEGVPVISLSDLPDSAGTVFLCSTRYLALTDMERKLKKKRNDLEILTLRIIEQLDDAAIPQKAYRQTVPSRYPMEIPEIEFLPGQDFILLYLPGNYDNTLSSGVGYVHNILKMNNIRCQTMDVSVILYHRYHSQKILDGLDTVISADGYSMKENPWSSLDTDEWKKKEVLEYFRRDIDNIVNKLIEAAPKIIGFSISELTREFTRKVVAGVRKGLPDVIIVVGGYDCHYFDWGPRLFNDFDYMIIHEAEMTLAPLVNSLLAGERPKNLPGVLSRYDSPNRIFEDVPLLQTPDSVDFPKYEWTDLNLYRGIPVPVTINRGCRWSRCFFCAERFPWRTRSSEKVVDEIKWFAERGFFFFSFNTSDMTGDHITLRKICEGIVERGLKVRLTGQMRIDKRSDRSFFDTLCAAGFKDLSFGIDGWTDHVLHIQNKGYNMRLVEQNLRDCYEAGIEITTNVVIGAPGETDEDVRETIENIVRNKQYIKNFNSIFTLILATGSVYWQTPEKFKIYFRGDKGQIYNDNPKGIPTHLWYSLDPYIDQNVRIERLKTICAGIMNGGVKLAYNVQAMVAKIIRGEFP